MLNVVNVIVFYYFYIIELRGNPMTRLMIPARVGFVLSDLGNSAPSKDTPFVPLKKVFIAAIRCFLGCLAVPLFC